MQKAIKLAFTLANITSKWEKCKYLLLNAKGVIALNCLLKSTKLAKSVTKFEDFINNLANFDLPSSRLTTSDKI